jgi:hypothetical protein
MSWTGNTSQDTAECRWTNRRVMWYSFGGLPRKRFYAWCIYIYYCNLLHNSKSWYKYSAILQTIYYYPMYIYYITILYNILVIILVRYGWWMMSLSWLCQVQCMVFDLNTACTLPEGISAWRYIYTLHAYYRYRYAMQLEVWKPTVAMEVPTGGCTVIHIFRLVTQPYSLL